MSKMAIFSLLAILVCHSLSGHILAGESKGDSVNPSKEQAEEQQLSLKEAQILELREIQKNRLEGIYIFEVRDQNEVPVPGVPIKFITSSVKQSNIVELLTGKKGNESGWLDTETQMLKTDINGRGRTEKASADYDISATIDSEGLPEGLSVDPRAELWSMTPDAKRPMAQGGPQGITYTFRVVKHGKPEPLREFEINERHPGDGSTWYISLFPSRWSAEKPKEDSWRPDFSVTAWRDPAAQLIVKNKDGSWTGPEDWNGGWSYSCEALHGGIQEVALPQSQEAPDHGYKSKFAQLYDLAQPSFVNTNDQTFWWRRSGNPDKYTLLSTEFYVDPYTGEVCFSFKGFLNPRGSRVMILPGELTPASRSWVTWITDDVDSLMGQDPIGSIPVVDIIGGH